MSQQGDPDSYWRRPAADPLGPVAQVPPPSPPAPAPPAYAGPPPSAPPPHDWQPAITYQGPPPRELPAQDLASIDDAESRARMITYGIGIAGGAVMILISFILCSHALFG